MEVVLGASSSLEASYQANCKRCKQWNLVNSGGVCVACLNKNLVSACKAGGFPSSLDAVSRGSFARRRLPGMPRAVLAVSPVKAAENCSLNASSSLPASAVSVDPVRNVELSQQQGASHVYTNLAPGTETQFPDNSPGGARMANRCSTVVETGSSFQKRVFSYKHTELSISVPHFHAADHITPIGSETRKSGLLPRAPPKFSIRQPQAAAKVVADANCLPNGTSSGRFCQSDEEENDFEADLMRRLLAVSTSSPSVPEPITLSFIRRIPVRPPSPPFASSQSPLWERRRFSCPLKLHVQTAAAAA